MEREALERLCEASVRADAVWGVLAARHLRGASILLESAAVAQGEARWILSRGEHELSPEEHEVFRRYDLHHLGLYLAAVAVENLLRGLWLSKRRPRPARGARTASDGMPRHDLAALARGARLELGPEERDLLADLSEILRWHHLPTADGTEHHGAYVTAGPRGKHFYRGKDALSADLPWPEALGALMRRLSRELESGHGS